MIKLFTEFVRQNVGKVGVNHHIFLAIIAHNPLQKLFIRPSHEKRLK